LVASEFPIKGQSGARSDERIGVNFLTIARCERLSLQHNTELRRWIWWNQLGTFATIRFTTVVHHVHRVQSRAYRDSVTQGIAIMR
jgi:hypothetical protein